MRDKIINRSMQIFRERPEPGYGRDVLGVWWDRADNIPFGLLGRAFFLLELFSATHDEEVKKALDEAIIVLEEDAAAKHTYNYGWFQGRSGLLYFYIELYRHLHEDRFLEKALRLFYTYADGAAPLFTLSGSPDLYGGSSGLALVLLHLYAETGDQHVLSALETAIAALLNSARLTGDRIGWDVLAERGLWGRGMAYGAPGIAFVFLELGRFFQNDSFISLADKMIPPGNEMSECTLYDRIGNHCVKSYANKLQGRNISADPQLQEEALAAITDNALPDGLYFRRAGIGQLSLEAARITGDKSFEHIARVAAENALNSINTLSNESAGLSGSAGEGYFLLRFLNDAGNSLLFPCVPPPQKEWPFQIGFDSIFFCGSHELYGPLLRRQFPFSYSVLEKQWGSGLAALEGDSLLKPEEWLERMEATEIASDSIGELKKLLDKDRFLLQAQRRFEGMPPAAEPNWQSITHNLLLDENEFDQLDFVWAPGLQIYQPYPQASAKGINESARILALFTEDSADAFICLRTAANAALPVPLGRDLLAFDLFTLPRSVQDAATFINQFIQDQELPVQLAIQAHLDADRPEQLPQAVRTMIRRVVRYYYMEGFLVTAQTAEINTSATSIYTISLK